MNTHPSVPPRCSVDAPSNALPDPLNRPGANAGDPEEKRGKWQRPAGKTARLREILDVNNPKKATEWAVLVGCSPGLVYQVAGESGKIAALVLEENDGTMPIEFSKTDGGAGRAYLPAAAVALLRKLGIQEGRVMFGEWDGRFVLLPMPRKTCGQK